jgi:competence protein ComEA
MGPPGVQVALPGTDGYPQIHQIVDGTPPVAVNEMTKDCLQEMESKQFQIVNGARYQPDLSRCEMNRGWIPAAQRMALLIPLHPDRMSSDDWQALRGVGPRLAEVIEHDRQIYGDFGCFEALDRVKGVGPKRISQWKKFFKRF